MDSIYLLPGDVMRLTTGRTAVLRARRGQLWVTFETAAPDRDTRLDHFLAPGECLRVAPGEVAVVSAGNPRLGQASFTWELVRQPAPAWAQLARLLRASFTGWATGRALAA